jgi:hypothetical protein
MVGAKKLYELLKILIKNLRSRNEADCYLIVSAPKL